MNTVDPDDWKAATTQAKEVIGKSTDLIAKKTAAETSFKETKDIGDRLVGNVEGRLRWLELLKAIDAVLPTEDDPANRPDDITARKELYISNMECQYVEDVATWFGGVKDYYQGPKGAKPAASGDAAAVVPAGQPPAAAAAGQANAGTAATAPASPGAAPAAAGEGATGAGPTGNGWIIKLEGRHYHNDSKKFGMNEIGEEYLRKTLIDGLMNGKVTLPTADRKGVEKVSMKELGISFPVLWKPGKVETVLIDNPKLGAPTDRNAAAAVQQALHPGGVVPVGDADTKISVPEFKFNVQFCWQPKLPTNALAEKEKLKGDNPPVAATATPNP